MTRRVLALLGTAAIAEAVLFNAAFTALGMTFDYPDILRRPAAEVLGAFTAGGPSLVLTWYAFGLTALAMVPLSLGLALARGLTGWRIAAGMLGALAGTVQAIGLFRWVFAVPLLAQMPEGRELGFLILNQWGGVAIGEHLGYLLTAGFLAAMAGAQVAEGARLRPALAALSALAMAVGAMEGLAIALGTTGEAFGLVAVIGYLGLSAWLVAEGLSLTGARLPRRTALA